MTDIISAEEYKNARLKTKIEFWISRVSQTIRNQMSDPLAPESIEIGGLPNEEFTKTHVVPIFKNKGWRCIATGGKMTLYTD